MSFATGVLPALESTGVSLSSTGVSVGTSLGSKAIPLVGIPLDILVNAPPADAPVYREPGGVVYDLSPPESLARIASENTAQTIVVGAAKYPYTGGQSAGIQYRLEGTQVWKQTGTGTVKTFYFSGNNINGFSGSQWRGAVTNVATNWTNGMTAGSGKANFIVTMWNSFTNSYGEVFVQSNNSDTLSFVSGRVWNLESQSANFVRLDGQADTGGNPAPTVPALSYQSAGLLTAITSSVLASDTYVPDSPLIPGVLPRGVPDREKVTIPPSWRPPRKRKSPPSDLLPVPLPFPLPNPFGDSDFEPIEPVEWELPSPNWDTGVPVPQSPPVTILIEVPDLIVPIPDLIVPGFEIPVAVPIPDVVKTPSLPGQIGNPKLGENPPELEPFPETAPNINAPIDIPVDLDCMKLKQCKISCECEDVPDDPKLKLYVTVSVTKAPSSQKTFLAEGSGGQKIMFAGWFGWTRGNKLIDQEIPLRRQVTVFPQPEDSDGYYWYPINGASLSVAESIEEV